MADNPLQILSAIEPLDLLKTEHRENLRWLAESIDDNPLADSVESLLKQISEGKCVLWTWGSGIFLTSIEVYEAGRVLAVTNVRGKDFLRQLDVINSDIALIAKDLGCKWIKGEVPRRGLADMYKGLGAKNFSFSLMEVK